MLYLGCVAGVIGGASLAPSTGLDADGFALTAVTLLVPALVGSRLLFVAQHHETYRHDPHRIWRRTEGGSALYGGLVLSVACSAPLLTFAGLPFWTFWDVASVTMLVGLIFTRIGCLMNGCCAGRPTDGLLGMWLPNTSGVWRRRSPTQLLEAGWAALILATVLLTWDKAPFDGALFGATVALYAGGRLVLGPMRDATHPHTLRVNALISAALVSAGCGILAVGWIT
jgi:phosphatidylglycerol:prolipoprotein diacylglycerol transferase